MTTRRCLIQTLALTPHKNNTMIFVLALPVYTRVYPIKEHSTEGAAYHPVHLSRPFVGTFHIPTPLISQAFYTHHFPTPIKGYSGFNVYRDDVGDVS